MSESALWDFAAGTTENPLVLDPWILLWAVVPVLAICFLVSAVRTYLGAASFGQKGYPSTSEAYQAQTLMRAERIRHHAEVLSPKSFASKRHFFSTVLLNLKRPEGFSPNLMNPEKMMGSINGMGGHMTAMLPQILMFSFGSYFFSGFVAMKLPFELTTNFRSMFQGGIESVGLDCCYVSALSLIMLAMYGLKGVTSFLLETGDASEGVVTVSEPPLAQQAMTPTNMLNDVCKKFQAAKKTLDDVEHGWILDDVEDRLLKRK